MNGVLVVDKPAGVSSARALNPVKRAVGRGVRVGHAGTLDPFATGVLLVMLGDATRLMPLVGRLTKYYHARARLGLQTDTLDPEGEVTHRVDPGPYNPDGLNSALFNMRGQIEQVPPIFSALKVDGRRAYKSARQGKQVDLKSRIVRIDHLGAAQVRWPIIDLHVACGSGTYIRSLARDIGATLGLPAMLEGLRRMRIGPFDVSRALPIPENREEQISDEDLRDALIPSRELAFASGVPRVFLERPEARRYVLGQRLRLSPSQVPSNADEPFAVFHEPNPGDIQMLGLGRWKDEEVLSPYKVFAGAVERLSEGGEIQAAPVVGGK